MIKKHSTTILVFITLFLLAFFSRLISHAWNFTLIGAVALFAGAYFANKSVSIGLIILSLFVSDAVIGFHNQMPAVYGSYLLIVALGFILDRNDSKNSRFKILGLSILGSSLFFLITNFSVWYQGTFYAANFQGLVECYLMGVPFFKNQFASDVIGSLVLFEVAFRLPIYHARPGQSV